jgi:hypothetical protein
VPSKAPVPPEARRRGWFSEVAERKSSRPQETPPQPSRIDMGDFSSKA